MQLIYKNSVLIADEVFSDEFTYEKDEYKIIFSEKNSFHVFILYEMALSFYILL